MKLVSFHLMPYRPLDLEEAAKHRSPWVVLPNRLYDPVKDADQLSVWPFRRRKPVRWAAAAKKAACWPHRMEPRPHLDVARHDRLIIDPGHSGEFSVLRAAVIIDADPCCSALEAVSEAGEGP